MSLGKDVTVQKALICGQEITVPKIMETTMFPGFPCVFGKFMSECIYENATMYLIHGVVIYGESCFNAYLCVSKAALIECPCFIVLLRVKWL